MDATQKFKLLNGALGICILIGLVSLIAGTLGVSWWNSTTNIEGYSYDGEFQEVNKGLWKTCTNFEKDDVTTEFCTDRDDLLKFKKMDDTKYNRDLDAVFLVLIISEIFAFAGLLSVLFMVTVLKKASSWECTALLITLFTFISGISAVSSLIYTEVQFDVWWDVSDHGWSIIITWFGACVLMVSFIISLPLFCMDMYERRSTVSYSTGDHHDGVAITPKEVINNP